MEINLTVIKVLKEYYTDNFAYDTIGNGLFELIRDTKGPRQGSSLSSFLFNICLERTLVHWKKSSQVLGLPIKENKRLFSLKYADDQVIIAQDAGDLEFILKRLNNCILIIGVS